MKGAFMQDPDGELLDRVCEIGDFFGRVMRDDSFDDWNLAQGFAEFLIRIAPDEVIGHALLARAYRHLGHLERAIGELEECRVRAKHEEMSPMERDFLLSFLEEENKLSSRPKSPA